MLKQESIFDIIAEKNIDNSFSSHEEISTARGNIKFNSINKILIHEHIFNRYPYRFRNESEQFTIHELYNAYNAGIDTIVDLTPYTNIYNYYKVIDESPVNIICCTGFYTPRFVPTSIRNLSEESLLKTYSKKIETGMGSRNIKPAILKVAAQKGVLSESEKKFFKVVSKLSRIYNLPIALHAPFCPLKHAMSLLDCGVDPTKLMVAHLENGICKEDIFNVRINEAIMLCKSGVYVQLADFGTTINSKKHNSVLILLSKLVENGFKNQIMVSSDSNWHWKRGVPILRGEAHGARRDYTYILKDAMTSIRAILGDADTLLFHNNPIHFLCRGDN